MTIKTGALVTLRFSLAWSDGSLIDIRKQTGLSFILTLPDDTTITITDLGYDELNNQVWVRISDTHTATAGTYKGNLSVFTTDLQMVTSGIVDLFTTSADGTETDAFINLFCTAIETPVNDGQGYSPKIVNSEWYVYDDSKKAYVATGQSVDGSNQIATKIAEYDATFDANETNRQSTFDTNEVERDAKVDNAVSSLGNKANNIPDTTNEEGFHIVDSELNVGMRYDNSGIDVALMSEHFKRLVKDSCCLAEITTNNFAIVDNNLNIGFLASATDNTIEANFIEY